MAEAGCVDFDQELVVSNGGDGDFMELVWSPVLLELG